MSKPSFVYVTFIRTTPEKLWSALISPDAPSVGLEGSSVVNENVVSPDNG